MPILTSDRSVMQLEDWAFQLFRRQQRQYGCSGDSIDEYLRMSKFSNKEVCFNFGDLNEFHLIQVNLQQFSV
jgi:hypothetical protein